MAKAKIALRLNEQTPEQKVANALTVNGLMASNVLVFVTPNPALTAYNTAALNVDSRLSTIATMEQNLETERSLLRESVVSSIRAVWYIVVYGITALLLVSAADWRLELAHVVRMFGRVRACSWSVRPSSARRASSQRWRGTP